MTDYISITPRQAKVLSGKTWSMWGKRYKLGPQPRIGGEAFLYSVHDYTGQCVAYLRFLSNRFVTDARLKRTHWMITSQLSASSSVFLAAPYHWAHTSEIGRPEGVDLDFSATLHAVVPGESWREIKARTEQRNNTLPSIAKRVRIAKNLIANFAAMETYGGQGGFVHGDPSDGNLVIDVSTEKCHFVDFDAFVYNVPQNPYPRLTLALGGVKGTPGYMPPALEGANTDYAFAYSDKFGRDMLLIELLTFADGDPVDVSPSGWQDHELTRKRLHPHAESLGLTHLLSDEVFTLAEEKRPTSREMAVAASCRMPDAKPPPFLFLRAPHKRKPRKVNRRFVPPPEPDFATRFVNFLEDVFSTKSK